MHRAWVRWSSRLRHWSGAGGRRGAGAAAAAGWAATGMGMMTAAGPGFDHDQPVKPALCRGPEAQPGWVLTPLCSGPLGHTHDNGTVKRLLRGVVPAQARKHLKTSSQRDASNWAGTWKRSDQRLRWSQPASWAWLDLNQRPHPYQLSRAQRCADRRLRRSRPTVGTKGMRSTGPWCASRHSAWGLLGHLLSLVRSPRIPFAAVSEHGP